MDRAQKRITTKNTILRFRKIVTGKYIRNTFGSMILISLLSGSLINVFAASQINLNIGASGTIIYAPAVTIDVDPDTVIGTNVWSPGFQLDGSDINRFRTSSELRNLAEQAEYKLIRFFEHRMGKPCLYWDEATRTGTWDWSEIDSLVQGIFNAGAEPLIVLGFYSWTQNQISSAPQGMSHDSITGLPYPDQWGAYTAEWVQHFEDVGLPVRFYEIINEPFHYFEWPADDTKLGYYMELFNAAASSMRAINPDVKIGSDASTFKKVLDALINEGEPLGFISFHMYGLDSRNSPDSQALDAAETRWLYESSSLWSPNQAVDLYRTERGLDVPVIMSEGNLCDDYDPCDPRMWSMLGTVYSVLTMRTFILRNFMYSIYFYFASPADDFGLINVNTYQPGHTYYAHSLIGNNLDVGDELIDTVSSSDDVRSLAWMHGDETTILLINKVDSTIRVRLEGISGQLELYKIDDSIPWGSPAIQQSSIDATDTIVMNGYTVILLKGNVNSGQPPTPPNSVFNEDYESGTFSLWSGLTTTSGDIIEISNIQPHQGEYHGLYTTDGDGWQDAYAYTDLNENEIYARGYFYVAEGVPLTDEDDRFYFIRYRAGDEWITGAGIRRQDGADKWVLYARDGDAWAGPVLSSGDIEAGRWYGIELHWRRDSTQGSATMYVDGVNVLEITGINTEYYGGVTSVDAGIVSSVDIQNGLTLYGDDLIISTAYVGP